jgi:hypothetical protein
MRNVAVRCVAWCALGALTTCALGGCYKADFHKPADRIIQDSAHTLPRNTWNPGLGLAGADGLDLGVFLGLRYGITDHTQAAINLAHMSVGIISVAVKQNFVDEDRWALGGQVGVTWANLEWLWVVPSAGREALADLDILSIPLSLFGTVKIIDQLDVTLEARYGHSDVFGEIRGDKGVGNGTLGARVLEFNPTIRGYILGRTALSLGFRLPAWASLPGESSALVEIEPGVLAGEQTSTWRRVPFENLWGMHFEAEFPVTKGFRIAAGIRHGVLNREVLAWPVVPSLRLEGRF